MWKLWIKDHTDLPLKVYQIVSVFRYETKATQPMIRVREVTTFKEAHTAHATMEEANNQVKEAIGIYKKFFDELGIPYMISRRPEWDKFAGAVYTIAFDTLMPDGRALQIGTVHNLGQKFSRAFDVKYLKPDGTHEYVYTTSYGISERVLAALIAIHGDDHGMVLPPKVAPIQVVIVPIPYKEAEEAVRAKCSELYKILKEAGIRVHYDDRDDVTPGEKFYYWELRGVPVRIEIGPKDLEANCVTISRRDTLERQRVPFKEVTSKLLKLFERISEDMRVRAWKWLKERQKVASSMEEAREVIVKHRGVALVPWCGREECGYAIEEEVDARVLGIPLDMELKATSYLCISCERQAETIIRVAKTY